MSRKAQVGKRSYHAIPQAGKRPYRKRHTAEEEAALCLEYQRAHAAKDHEAARAAAAPLVADLYNLAKRVATLKASATLPYEDVFQVALLGVMDAIRLFDPSRGCRLVTLASWRIRAAISHTYAARGRRRGIQWTTIDRHWSFDETPGRDQNGSELAWVENPREDATHDLRLDLIPATAALSGREMAMISRFYGLDGSPRQTLREIGEEAGITKERVRQIVDKAREKLASRLKGYENQ